MHKMYGSEFDISFANWLPLKNRFSKFSLQYLYLKSCYRDKGKTLSRFKQKQYENKKNSFKHLKYIKI
jgi:hypothetical protein